MSRKLMGGLCILFGALLILAAAFLVLRNEASQSAAENASMEVLELLEPMIETTPTENSIATPDLPVEIPDYQYNPDMPMPITVIDGVEYIGTIEIPALEIKLPIITTSTMPNMQKAPCRYCGSAYQDNLVIGAHNYPAHFGRLKDLSYGDEIRIYDMDGNEFLYEISDIEILQPNQLDYLIGTDWPLSLYTCTATGQTRLVVRCDKAK